MENPCRSRRFLPPARSTTTCCRRRSGSSSAARRSRPSHSVAVVRWPAGDRADRRPIGADDSVVRIAARPARAGAASVHGARSAAGAGDRRGAVDPLPRDLRSRSRCSSAASCSAGRSRIATSARSSTRWPIRIRRRRGGPGGDGDRGAARRRDVELREPLDLVRRADSRYRRRSARIRARRRGDQAFRYTQALTGIKTFYRLC